MTREDVIHMFALRLDGMTLEQIANQYGVTRERIRQILENAANGSRISKGCKCIYKGLKNWFMATGITAYKMNKELNFGKGVTPLYNRLSGEKQFDINEIKKILAYTGMTFEEAFGEVEE